MRINVYAEEITGEVGRVAKTITDDSFGTRTFHGVRMFLASPDVLHHGADDRSAITLWVPWTRAEGHRFDLVRATLVGLLDALTAAEREARAEPAPIGTDSPRPDDDGQTGHDNEEGSR